MATDFHLGDARATEHLGACVARNIRAPVSIWLRGALGSGKTTFCRGFVRVFSPGERVKSPTYTLLETYSATDFVIHHFDFYRITKPGELEFVGIRECFADNCICLIEWPENAGKDLLPPPQVEISLAHTQEEQARRAVLDIGDKQRAAKIKRDYLGRCAV